MSTYSEDGTNGDIVQYELTLHWIGDFLSKKIDDDFEFMINSKNI